MAKWTRITLSFFTLLTAAFIILGALLPTFTAKIEGRTASTVGLLKTCVPRHAHNHGGMNIDGSNRDSEGKASINAIAGLRCVDNDETDKIFNNKAAQKAREFGSSIVNKAKQAVGEKDHDFHHTYHTRPTAEKVSVGFLCTAGVITALIAIMAMFPSLSFYAFSYMMAPLVLQVIGFGLMIWTGIERYNATSAGVASRGVGGGLGLQIAGLIMMIVLTGLWSMPSARKEVLTKYSV